MRREPPAGRSIFLLTRAKWEALRILAEYFCERTNGIAELRHGKPPGEAQLRSLRRTLFLLYREGLVVRLPYLAPGTTAGGFTYVYGLSPAGVRLVGDAGFASGATKTFGEHSARTLDHELLITAFHRAVARHARVHGLELYWLQRNLKKRDVHPDAVFALTDPRLADDRNTRYWFLEIERAKPGGYENGEPQIARKLRAYAGYAGSRACEKDWGDFRHFQAVIVAPTPARARSLISRCKEFGKDLFIVLAEEQCTVKDIAAALR